MLNRKIQLETVRRHGTIPRVFSDRLFARMKTVLFITDLYAGSRVPELAGVREVGFEKDWHVEEIELLRLKGSVSHAIRFWKPDGIILEGSGNISFPRRSCGNLPLVHLDPDNKTFADPSAFTVTNDAERIADLAVAELLKTGCGHFAFIGWTKRSGWSYRRERRFCRRLAKLGKRCSVLNDPWTYGNKADFAVRLRPFLAALPRPCGIFTANDGIAAALLDICNMDGLRIPGELFVVGVDDDPVVCDNLRPSLTSIRPGFVEGGRMAARMLARLMANPSMPAEKVLYPPVGATQRLSTRRVMAHPNRITKALDLIRREACSGLKAADVVRAMGVSERLAEMQFRAATGKRITEEIADMRLERVFGLLSRPDQAIAPIAHLCGWESDVFLKRLFKRRTGMTMREWRNRHPPVNPQSGIMV